MNNLHGTSKTRSEATISCVKRFLNVFFVVEFAFEARGSKVCRDYIAFTSRSKSSIEQYLISVTGHFIVSKLSR